MGSTVVSRTPPPVPNHRKTLEMEPPKSTVPNVADGCLHLNDALPCLAITAPLLLPGAPVNSAFVRTAVFPSCSVPLFWQGRGGWVWRRVCQAMGQVTPSPPHLGGECAKGRGVVHRERGVAIV